MNRLAIVLTAACTFLIACGTDEPLGTAAGNAAAAEP